MNLYQRLERFTAHTTPAYLDYDEDEKDREFLKIVVNLYDNNRPRFRCLQRYFNDSANFITTSERIAAEMETAKKNDRAIKQAIQSL